MPGNVTTASVYRAPMRSREGDVPDGLAVERALTEGICGFGGRLDPPPRDLDDALRSARTQHDDRLARRIGRFAAAPRGAYVWTRDGDGMFWLGRLHGEWRYDSSEAAWHADLVHVRPCEWLPAPVAESRVPTDVLATFARGGRNWQGTHSDSARDESDRIWRAGAADADSGHP